MFFQSGPQNERGPGVECFLHAARKVNILVQDPFYLEDPFQDKFDFFSRHWSSISGIGNIGIVWCGMGSVQNPEHGLKNSDDSKRSQAWFKMFLALTHIFFFTLDASSPPPTHILPAALGTFLLHSHTYFLRWRHFFFHIRTYFLLRWRHLLLHSHTYFFSRYRHLVFHIRT